MTFILALANSEQVIQISDCSRMQNGSLEDEKFNKAGHILCDNASVLYGFTGLATVAEPEKIQHAVQDWMLDALDIAIARAFESSGRIGYFIEEIEMELAYVASLHFRQAMFLEGIEEADRRLTIMMTGFKNDGSITHTLVSNCLDQPVAQKEFTIQPVLLKSWTDADPTLVQAIGQIGAFHADEEQGLRTLLKIKAPAEAIRDRAASIVANRRKSQGASDRKITAAILRRNMPEHPILEYKSNEAGDMRAFLDFVRCQKDQPVRMSKNVFGSRLDEKDFLREMHENTPRLELSSG